MPIDCEALREALQALYDSLTLAQCDLAKSFPSVACLQDPARRAQELRAILLDAIELIQPGRPASFQSAAARCYQVLTLHYVEGFPVADIAEELHISRRQAYRDLVRAEEKLAEFLEARTSHPYEDALTAISDDDPLLRELQRFEAPPEPVGLACTVRAAVDLVQPLADTMAVCLSVHTQDTGITVHATEEVLLQTLVKMLSIIVRHAAGGHASIHVTQDRAAKVSAYLSPRSKTGLTTELRVLRSLAQTQKFCLQIESVSERIAIKLIMPRTRQVILVIEDNESTVALYQRYLSQSRNLEMIVARDPMAGMEMAKKHRPDMIILDIMMPGSDGWSALQNLRSHRETHDIPIVICTVFDEVDLAKALGANGYLKKPITQQQLLREVAAHLFLLHTEV